MAGRKPETLTPEQVPEQEAEKQKALTFIEEVAGGLGGYRQTMDDVLTIFSEDGKLPELKGVRRSPGHPWVSAEGKVIDESELYND